MPWKESSVVDERIRFVIRLKDSESMASLCREFQISRKTGHKIFERYEECGFEVLMDRARRSTIHAILDRHGLVTRVRRSRTHTEGTPLSAGANPNSPWCADYKGEFMLGNRSYCYPLTVIDHASRYLLRGHGIQRRENRFYGL